MKTLYLDLGMGAAGDMLTAALLELTDDRERFVSVINNLMPEGVEVTMKSAKRCGIAGTLLDVSVHGTGEDCLNHEFSHDHEHNHEHGHSHSHSHSHGSLSSPQKIFELIDDMLVSEKIKRDAKAVYKIISAAESKVHVVPEDLIHYHEVGSLDAVADIVSVCLLIDHLAPDRIVASTVNVGGGSVKCAHGILPVPAPATAEILRGIPIVGGGDSESGINSELCTPTGAALAAYFVDSFGPIPAMTVERIGYGMGHKEFDRANCVRALLGESYDSLVGRADSGHSDTIVELCSNIDDATPETIGFAMSQLMAEGALDVYTTPVVMKKSRPGFLLTVVCREKDEDRIVRSVFRYTTTLGIRRNRSDRYTLRRRIVEENTELGAMHIKEASGFGVVRRKYEYEDLARAAADNSLSIDEVLDIIAKSDRERQE